MKQKRKSDKDEVLALSLGFLRKALQQRDLEPITLEQHGRYAHGVVACDNTPMFIKIASSPGVAQAARNEVRWNRCLSKNGKRPFFVPKIYEAGYLGEHYFFCSEICTGKPIADYNIKTSAAERSAMKWLNKIVDITFSLMELPKNRFVWDSIYLRLKNPGKRYFRRSLWYQKELRSSKLQLEEVLEMAQPICSLYRPGISHGDFTPWHLIEESKSKVALIDGEMASSTRPRFYDAAFFYQRVYTALKWPNLAKAYLSKVRSQIPQRQRNTFDKEIYALLAERVLGSYWDKLCGKHKTVKHVDLRLNHAFKRDLLKGEIY